MPTTVKRIGGGLRRTSLGSPELNVGPVQHCLRRSVLAHAGRVESREAGLLVDEIDGNHECLRHRGIDAAVGRAAAVLHLHGKGRRAEDVGGGRVGERAVGGDRRQAAGGEQA